MEKDLLLAIGDDRAASYNLRFLNEVFDSFCDLKMTLFYVAPRVVICDRLDTNRPLTDDEHRELVAHKKGSGKKALEDARRWIVDVAGCSGEKVRTKVVHSKVGTVRELIDEARNGLYDALVLGRKEFSWFEEIFENSVCHELLWQDIDFPIWVCKRPPDHPRHDILLCMDGSEPSLRMVDHAGYMLAEEPRHTFTLFHVAQQGYETARAGRIFDEGLALLGENGVPDDRIELKMVTDKNVVKAILSEVQVGNYSAVGVGRHGTSSQTRMENLFPSTVSVQLLRQLTDAALWISK
ncbi:universal stress protein [Pseudodesulfovibrio sp. S3]|uniref:universal stress protein n=1 Tax=unclassified Pseudodesulfovibrio TaxID=2661612 RepID=UPI000FEB8E99|nr:universal stress protein [Pseudodesulfovibrio sp. S3]MCJ2165622.1 universal stress protein [Pseudodesulfovibrio sp. S3-i]RWU03029.1 universal stress protein [Pseudodesulfovibrio sp. S3]